jgi:hypothetical protein
MKAGGEMPNEHSGRRGAMDIVTAALRAAGLTIMAAVVVVLAANAARFVADACTIVPYPLGLDGGEGLLLSDTTLLISGATIYTPIDEPPYTVANYPPVYHAITALARLLLRDTLAAGRSVSVASTLLMTLGIGLLVWRAGHDVRDGPARGLAAAAGALTFLGIGYVYYWGLLMRVDMLANLLAFGGLLVFVRWAGNPRKVYWCVPLFVLALYTRQSTVAAAAACLVVALIARPRLGVRLLAAMAAGALVLFGLLDTVTHGQFYLHTVSFTTGSYSWHRTHRLLSDILKAYPVYLTLGSASAISLIRAAWPTVASRQSRADAGGAFPAPLRWERPVLGVYVLTAFLVGLTSGKEGAYYNYFIELTAAMCASLGVLLTRPFAAPGTGARRSTGRRLAASALRVGLPALVLAQVALSLGSTGKNWFRHPGRPDPFNTVAERLLALELVKQASGPVLCEDTTLPVRAGKRVEYQPFAMTQLAYRGRWDQSKLLRRIDSGDFALIVLNYDLYTGSPFGYQHFTPEMMSAIRARYRLRAALGGYWVYEPR